MSEQPPLHDPIADAFEGFRGDSLPAFVPPGADLVRGTVRRRKQARTATAVACAAVILAGAGIAVASKTGPIDRLEPADPPKTTPTPGTSRSLSPTPTPSSTPSADGPAASLAATNWRDQAVPITGTDGCPGGTVTFENGAATVGGYIYRILPASAKAAFGDLDQDGKADAVLALQCGNGGELGNYLIGVGNSTPQPSASPGTASGAPVPKTPRSGHGRDRELGRDLQVLLRQRSGRRRDRREHAGGDEPRPDPAVPLERQPTRPARRPDVVPGGDGRVDGGQVRLDHRHVDDPVPRRQRHHRAEQPKLSA